MEITRERINADFFTIMLKTDYEDGTNEVKMFSDIWDKIRNEARRIGFKKLFNKEEREFIDEMCGYFVPPEEKPNGVQAPIGGEHTILNIYEEDE